MPMYIDRVQPGRVLLSFEDDHGVVRLELLDIEPLFEREPIQNIVQRQLHRVQTVLEQSDSSDGLVVYIRDLPRP